jgi:L-asparaginase / beta-aspartyl-peptidase
MQTFSIAIHGGAGTILQKDMTPELEKQYTQALDEAITAGYEILHKQGTALQAVKAAVVALENNVLFNAGRGSVFTKTGEHEMDAAIMNGLGKTAGAVAGVKNIKNPIELAELVMLKTNHVLLSGIGANDFAAKMSFELMPDDYFFSQFRYEQWQALKDTDGYSLDHTSIEDIQAQKEKKFGTVGAVACDVFGNIAAATSTGGMTNKKFGRVGDTPIVGAGTYADNNTCAISCTGHGEPFLKALAAYDVAARMQYKGIGLQDAMQEVVHGKLIEMEGEGGMIGVDKQGNISMQFNSDGMYRAMQTSNGIKKIEIYK